MNGVDVTIVRWRGLTNGDNTITTKSNSTRHIKGLTYIYTSNDLPKIVIVL